MQVLGAGIGQMGLGGEQQPAVWAAGSWVQGTVGISWLMGGKPPGERVLVASPTTRANKW